MKLYLKTTRGSTVQKKILLASQRHKVSLSFKLAHCLLRFTSDLSIVLQGNLRTFTSSSFVICTHWTIITVFMTCLSYGTYQRGDIINCISLTPVRFVTLNMVLFNFAFQADQKYSNAWNEHWTPSTVTTVFCHHFGVIFQNAITLGILWQG